MVMVPGVPGAMSGAVSIGTGAGATPVCSVVVVVVCVTGGGGEPHPARGKALANIMPHSSMRVFAGVIVISLCSISRTLWWLCYAW